jgi:integrin alpha FG-GAP repeat containing protein 1
MKSTAIQPLTPAVAQLPQTAYHAVGTPYAFVGLGRTNNYVEASYTSRCPSGRTDLIRPSSNVIQRISVGASLYPPGHTQLLINPPSPADNDSHPPVRARSAEWRSELYLHPGDWVPWVGAAVVGMVIILGGVVLGLHEREKVSRKALHGWGGRTRMWLMRWRRRRTRRSDGEHFMRSTSRRCKESQRRGLYECICMA